jgi:hypothetical protein
VILCSKKLSQKRRAIFYFFGLQIFDWTKNADHTCWKVWRNGKRSLSEQPANTTVTQMAKELKQSTKQSTLSINVVMGEEVDR